jgi:hypothetical protein
MVTPIVPYGYSIFCDDIRYEVDGKVSPIGVYTMGTMLVHSEYPIILPKLGCILGFAEPVPNATTREFPIVIKVFLPGETNQPFHTIPSLTPDRQARERAINAFGVAEDAAGYTLYQRSVLPLLFQNVVIKQSGSLRIMAEYGDESLSCGSLRVLHGREFELVRKALEATPPHR